ncbi:MAG: hypothetical protein F6K26_40110 [Moorea sp. SIO2I5]|nr:hypothetical protein [Moorena sp. SIO2I5]
MNFNYGIGLRPRYANAKLLMVLPKHEFCAIDWFNGNYAIGLRPRYANALLIMT